MEKTRSKIHFTIIFVSIVMGVLFPTRAGAQSNVDPLPLRIGNGIGLGLHLGFESTFANLYPSSEKSSEGTTPDIYIAGLNARYKYKFLYFRAGAEGGLSYPDAKGKTNTTGQDISISVTAVHMPFSLGINLPLTRKSGMVFGMGYSYHIATIGIKNAISSDSYSIKTTGYHIFIGSEIKLTEKGYVTFEWMHTYGLSAVYGHLDYKVRQFSLNGSRILMGYTYYFIF